MKLQKFIKVKGSTALATAGSVAPGSQGVRVTTSSSPPQATSEADFLGATLFSDDNDDDCGRGTATRTRECTFFTAQTLEPQHTPYMKRHSKSQQAYKQQKRFIYQRPIQSWICIFQKEGEANRPPAAVRPVAVKQGISKSTQSASHKWETNALSKETLVDDPTCGSLYVYLYIYIYI